MDPAELEALIDRELKALPRPRAPRTLLPRTLAAAGAWQRRPWYARAWTTWPVAGRTAALAALVVMAAVLVAIVPAVQGYLAALLPAATGSDLLREMLATAQRTMVAAGAARIVWTSVVAPVAVYLIVLVGVLYVGCVACGVALERVASGRVWSS